MHNQLPNTLVDVASFLDQLADNQAAPEVAYARLTSLRARHPDSAIELVWEDQAFDGSFHYDALIRPPYGGTVSISVCRDSVLPWALRGLQRWRDSDLLRVNSTVLSVADAIAQLDLLWEQKPLMRRLIDSCVVEAELQRTTTEVTQREVQLALDGIRRGRGLLTAVALKRWLQDSGTTVQQLEDMATRFARATKLRERIEGTNAEAYFRAHRNEFDTVRIAIAQLPTESSARRIVDRVEISKISFLEAVQDEFLRDTSRQVQLSFRNEFRYKLNAEFGGLTESEAARLNISCDSASGVKVIQVLSQQVAEWNDSTQHAVQTKLFDEWLAAQRREAKVEWFWGKSSKTDVTQSIAA